MPITIIFRTDDFTKWGAGFGSDLSAIQVDLNFWYLKQAVETLQDDMPAAAVGIVDFSVTGDQFFVNMTDESVQGPYQLPAVRWNNRGVWAEDTEYLIDDVFTVESIAYITLFSHMSVAPFDPGANDGFGNDYYAVLMDFHQYVVPQVDRITNNTFTPTRADVQKYWRVDSAGDVNGEIVVTLNAGIFNVSDEMHFRQVQAGKVSVVAGAGVTILGVTGFVEKTQNVGAVLTAKCVDTDVFDVFGMLEAA